MKPSPRRKQEQERALLKKLLKGTSVGDHTDQASTLRITCKPLTGAIDSTAIIEQAEIREHPSANNLRSLGLLKLLKYALTVLVLPAAASLLFPKEIAAILTTYHRPTVLVRGGGFTQPRCQLFMFTVGPKYLEKSIDHLQLSMRFSGKIVSYGYGIDSEIDGSEMKISDHFQVSADCKVLAFSQEPPNYLRMSTPGEQHRVLQIDADRVDETSGIMMFVSTRPGPEPFPQTSGKAVYKAWGQELSAPIELTKIKINVIDVKEIPPLP